MRYVNWTPVYDLQLSSDAAFNGFGILLGNEWIASTWPADAPKNIAILEAIPLVIAAMIWGEHWRGMTILFYTDNISVVFSAESLLPSDPHLAFLMRELAMNSIKFDFEFKVEHLPGVDNTLADLLSRSRFEEFFALHPDASPLPVEFDLQTVLYKLINYKL